MTDVVDPATRSRMMSGIRGKDTKPELIVRKALFAKGFRYKLHDKTLPGKPDLVFPKYRAVVFVHGCFWHGHNCHLFKWPKTRPDFWEKKICRNREVDERNYHQLKECGWSVITVWECALKGRKKLPIEKVANFISGWLKSGDNRTEIKGDGL